MPTLREMEMVKMFDDQEYLRGIIESARIDEVDGETVGITVSSDDFDWLCQLASEGCRSRRLRKLKYSRATT